MHAERNYLNRFVLPELRNRCRLRGVEFVSVDLRWGVTPEEVARRGTLKICLEEMERCKPFFICLMGDRYGWISAPEEVPQAIFEAVLGSGRLTPEEGVLLNDLYKIDLTVIPPVYRLGSESNEITAGVNEALVRLWELHDADGTLNAGYSITAREILKAVFDEQHRMSRAFFYLRRQGGAGIHDHPHFPTSFIPSFLETEERSRAKLRSLKEHIRGKAGELVVREYEAEYAGVQIDPALLPHTLSDEDRTALQDGMARPEAWPGLSGELRAVLSESGSVALSGMEEFGAQVLDDLWAGIEAELETERGPVTVHVDEPRPLGHHDRFILNHTRLFVGRRELMGRMLAYARDGEGDSPLILTGAAGVGKSALLAKFTEECGSQLPAPVVLPYFIGASPGSEQLSAMLGGVCGSLRGAGGFDFELPSDPDELRRLFPSLLREVARQKQVVLIIDALDQLDPAGHSHELLWFPFTLPPGACVVVSTQEGKCLDRLAARVPPDRIMVVPQLPLEDRRRLISESLALRGKRLSEDHLDELLDLHSRPDAGLPLYLLVALEELCLFGSYEALGQRIHLLAPQLSELFQQVLARLEQDYSSELVRPVLRWLAASRSGLLESEIIDLLHAHRPHFQMVHWLRLYRAMQFYLRPMEEGAGLSSEGRIAFFYEQLRLSVFERYFHMESFSAAPTEEYQRAHGELADYFVSVGRTHDDTVSWRSNHPRALGELPHHLVQSGRRHDLIETLMDLSFLEAKAKAGMAFDLAMNLSEAAKLPLDSLTREHLSTLERALRDDIYFIVRHPETLFQCLWNRCRWHDSPEAGRYFEPADGSANPDSLPGPKLFERLESWRAEKEQRAHDFRWVRALRPLSPSSGDDHQFILRRHTHAVFAVAFSPDGGLIASGSKDATVRVWDVTTGEERACLVGHRNQVQSVAFTGDGAYVVSGSGNPEMRASDGTLIGETDYTVRVWNIADGTEVARYEGHRGMVHCVAVSPDGRRVASGDSEGVVRLWDIRGGSELESFNAYGESVHRLKFSPDGRLLFSSSFEGIVRVWHAETGKELSRLTFGEKGMLGMSVSPDWDRVGVAELRKGITVRDWLSGQEIIHLPTTGVTDVAWSADGRHIIGAGGGTGAVHVWEATTGIEVAAYRGHEGTVTGVAASPDGRLFASCSMDGTVRVWSLSASKPQAKIRGHDATILCLRYSPDGRYFATGSEDNSACLWNAADGSLIARLEGHTQPVICVEFLEGGRQLASGSYDDTLFFWQTETARKIGTTPGKSFMPNSIGVSPDGRRFAHLDLDGAIKVMDAPTMSELFRLRGEGDESILVMSQDGNHLAAAGMFGTVEVWDLRTRAKLASLKEAGNGITCVAFSPVGTRLACGSSGAVKVWDWDSHATLDLEGHWHLVSGVAFSPDGLFLVSDAEDGTARIWSSASGLCVGIVSGGVDAKAIADGYPLTVSIHESHETSFVSAADGSVAGWFPAMPGMLTTLPDRRTWFGVARTGHLYAFRMEGEERPSVSVLEQVPLLSLSWGAAALSALREGDVARAMSLLDHMESVCREFKDERGLSECERLRAALKQDEDDDSNEDELTRAAKECLQFFINRDYLKVVQVAMALGQEMYLDHTLLQVFFISIQRVMLADRQASEDWVKRFAPGFMEPIKDPWQIQLLMTTLGQKEDMNQLLRVAQTREQFCQGCYYLGARLMIDGYLEEAMKAFEMSLGSNADCVEYMFAQADSRTVRDVLSRQ
jgi:WD40 repeat protein